MLIQVPIKICLLLITIVTATHELRKFRKNAAFSADHMDGKWSNVCEKCWEFRHINCEHSDFIVETRCACAATESSNFPKHNFIALKDLRTKFYNLHVPWQSIAPNGNTKNIDKIAINYYKKVIDDILNNGIEPIIVITCDLQTLLGRKNKELIEYFGDFARLLFETFENRVKHWLVIDEHCLQCSKEKITPYVDTIGLRFGCSDWHADTNSKEVITAEGLLLYPMVSLFKLTSCLSPEFNRPLDLTLLEPLIENCLYATLEAVSRFSFQEHFVLNLKDTCELLLNTSHSALINAVSSGRKFPEDFILGSASAAYQIEGGWDADGRGESMWDYYLHKYPSVVEDRTNGDVAADSYHLYKRDVQLLKELGAKSYRFSISWTRVLPNGTANYINPLGIAYYNNLINELLANDIMPLVTIYHWDLPIGISNQGGWLSEKTVDYFVDYARVVFAAFGDRVKHWITINEPNIHCKFAYGTGDHPPLIKSPGIGYYECGRNLLLAHAGAYRLYNEEFRELQGGEVGITLDLQWPIAASDSKEDIEATEDYIAFYFGQYIDPIFKGNYPRRLTARLAEVSASQGYNSSRLRTFTKEQRDRIKGTADFLGINHYSSSYVYRNASVIGMYDAPSFDDDADLAIYSDPSWPASALPVMTEYAPGFYDLLIYLKNNYKNPIVYVTESGFPLRIEDGLDDDRKVHYLRSYLDALLDAKAAGSNVQGYFFWTLVDTFEWASGYTVRFALYQVDTDDPARPRTARKSALVYREIIHSKTVDHDYDPDPYEQIDVK